MKDKKKKTKLTNVAVVFISICISFVSFNNSVSFLCLCVMKSVFRCSFKKLYEKYLIMRIFFSPLAFVSVQIDKGSVLSCSFLGKRIILHRQVKFCIRNIYSIHASV